MSLSVIERIETLKYVVSVFQEAVLKLLIFYFTVDFVLSKLVSIHFLHERQMKLFCPKKKINQPLIQFSQSGLIV